jgi:hypothetical protein
MTMWLYREDYRLFWQSFTEAIGIQLKWLQIGSRINYLRETAAA